jgi:myosin heavy subunit
MSVLNFLLSSSSVAEADLALDKNVQELVSEVTICLQDLHETIEIWREINLNRIQSDFPDNVILLTENREEYLKKRKLLISLIRNFTTSVLTDDTSLTIPEIQEQCRILVDQFKADFDNLSSMCKKTEGFYLELYKALREAPDPVMALSNSSMASHRVMTTLQEKQDLIQKYKAELIHKDNQIKELLEQQQEQSSRLSASSSSDSSHDRHQSELIEMKAVLENEYQRREQLLRSSFEQKYSQIISQSEKVIQEKDYENEQLNELLTSLRNSVSQLQEEHELYLLESDKRHEVENKLHLLARKFSEISDENESLQSEMKVLEKKYQTLDKKLTETLESSEETVREYEENLRTLSEEKRGFEEQLRRFPPIDFDDLLNKLGLSYDQDLVPDMGLPSLDQRNSINLTESTPTPRWSHQHIISYLQNVIRRYQQVVSESQTDKSLFMSQLTQCEEENQTMREQIDSNHETILKLERDLTDAYSSIEVGKALLKCHSMMSGTSHRHPSNEVGDSLDIESAESGGSGPNSTIIKGILNQRDRMMKLARDKEGEVTSLQSQINSLSLSNSQLKQENLQLYQRIRSLRTSISTPLSHSSGRNDEEEGAEGEDIESKYRSLYEASLDLSQILLFDHDRQVLHAQLTDSERCLISFFRFIVHDSFRRLSYLGYMLLVHLMLLHYLFLILTPEVDSDSTSTMSLMEPPPALADATSGS